MSKQFVFVLLSLFYTVYTTRNTTSSWGCRAESPNSTSDFNPVADIHLYTNDKNYDIVGTFSNFKNKSLVAIGDACKNNQIIQTPPTTYLTVQTDLTITGNNTSINISSSALITDVGVDTKNRTCNIFTFINDGADKGKLQEIGCGNWILDASYTGISLILISLSLISLLI